MKTKGSVSFSQIKMKDLAKMLGPEATVVISKKWASLLKMNVEMVQEQDEQIEIKITE
ncbi:MAG: hypothetical protein AABY22_04590 [Nanoarchaeota archaeon]